MAASPLRAPRWIVAHAMIAVLTVTFVLLGQWQLQRYAEEQAAQERLEARLATEPVPLDAALAATDDAEFLRVTATGRYRVDDEVLLRSRANQGVNGFHVLTPLDTGAGQGVIVNRGWVPFDLDVPPVTPAVPPGGDVTVTGTLTTSQTPRGIGPTDPPTGRLERVFHADVERLQAQIGVELAPVILRLDSQRPPQAGRLPIPAPPPEFDPNQNLGYAIQWFAFAVIAVVGYGFGLRHLTRQQRTRSTDAVRGDSPVTPRRS